jgi:hypothetical protein
MILWHILFQEQVSAQLQNAEFTFKWDKSIIGACQNFCHILSSSEICIANDGHHFLEPRSLKVVQNYLGMIAFFTRFILKFSKLSAHLISLRNKNVVCFAFSSLIFKAKLFCSVMQATLQLLQFSVMKWMVVLPPQHLLVWLIAVGYGCEHFCSFLKHKEFIVHTDHKSIVLDEMAYIPVDILKFTSYFIQCLLLYITMEVIKWLHILQNNW